jgi:hypothetical protein
MSSFKNLIRSDISVVPYEANKQWSLSYCPYPTSSRYLTIYKGTNVTGSFSADTDPVTENQYERLVYAQINHLFYQIYTASLNTSSLANSIYYESASQQRPTASYFIYNDKDNLVRHFPTGANEGIRVIKINQNVYGNKILPYTFMLSSSGYFITDDGFGNLLTLQGSAELYINNGYFNAASYFADNIVDINSYIGNIFYAHGIAIITNQSFQSIFPLPPLTVNDTVYFQTTDSPKTVSPLTNDNGRGGTIDDTTLTLSGSASELALWINNGDGTIELNTTTEGIYNIYYTVEASYDCGNIISNKSKITAVVTVPPPTTTTTTTSTTTTTTTVPTTTTTSTTTTTTTVPTTSTTTTTTTVCPCVCGVSITNTSGGPIDYSYQDCYDVVYTGSLNIGQSFTLACPDPATGNVKNNSVNTTGGATVTYGICQSPAPPPTTTTTTTTSTTTTTTTEALVQLITLYTPCSYNPGTSGTTSSDLYVLQSVADAGAPYLGTGIQLYLSNRSGLTNATSIADSLGSIYNIGTSGIIGSNTGTNC